MASRGIRWAPIAWGLGITGGALAAVIVSPYVPGWGVALAPPGAILLFAIGAYIAPNDPLVAMVLRVATAVTLGFTATTVPITLDWLDAGVPMRALLLEEAGATRGELVWMWMAMGAGGIIGVVGEIVRGYRVPGTGYQGGELPR